MALADRSVMCERMVVPKGIGGDYYFGVPPNIAGIYPSVLSMSVQSITIRGTKSAANADKFVIENHLVVKRKGCHTH